MPLILVFPEIVTAPLIVVAPVICASAAILKLELPFKFPATLKTAAIVVFNEILAVPSMVVFPVTSNVSFNTVDPDTVVAPVI